MEAKNINSMVVVFHLRTGAYLQYILVAKTIKLKKVGSTLTGVYYCYCEQTLSTGLYLCLPVALLC